MTDNVTKICREENELKKSIEILSAESQVNLRPLLEPYIPQGFSPAGRFQQAKDAISRIPDARSLRQHVRRVQAHVDMLVSHHKPYGPPKPRSGYFNRPGMARAR